MHEVHLDAKKEEIPPLSCCFYFVLSCDQETTVPYQTGESRETENTWPQKNRKG